MFIEMDLFFDLFSLIFAQNCQHIMLPWWLSGKRIHLQCRRCGFDPWVGKIICRRKWQPAPVVLLGKFHGQRSLDGYSPQGCKISDMTEWLSTHNAVLILFFPISFTMWIFYINLVSMLIWSLSDSHTLCFIFICFAESFLFISIASLYF